MVKSISNKTLRILLSGLLSLTLAQAVLTPAWADGAERKVIKTKAPVYPRAAERRGIEGFVVLKYTVLASGEVSSPEVIEATPEGVFDRAAIKAVSGWKYEAASADTPDVQIKITFKQ